jgi:probable rRNA maturation factor
MKPNRRASGTLSSRPFVLSITAPAGKQHVAFLSRHVRAAHGLLRPVLRELSLALVGDARMSALHRQFMGIAGPTDVLTFPLEVDRRGRALAGEVVICVPEARRQAGARGTRIERELLLYALHGMLHLQGFDDRTESAFQTMHRMEDDILTRLGLGPVFAPPKEPPAVLRRAVASAAVAARRASA